MRLGIFLLFGVFLILYVHKQLQKQMLPCFTAISQNYNSLHAYFT